MKYITLGIVFWTMLPCCARAQKFRIHNPPIEGYYYLDTTKCDRFNAHTSLRCIEIMSETSTVVSSANGRVIFCHPLSNRTYELGIKYGQTVMVYTNISKRNVMNGQTVVANYPIGELPQNPKDKKFHLGLQVWNADASNTTLWGGSLVRYLHSTSVDAELLTDAP